MTSALNKLPEGTIELTITIPHKRVSKLYDGVVERFAKTVEIKGFRKGKAPKKLIEERLDKSKVYEEVLKELIPQVYIEAIKEHKVTPIVNPKVQVISLEEGKDWIIKALTCELPKVELGNYKEAVRKALAAEKIWTPGKEKEEEKKQEKEEDRLRKVFDILLETVKVEVPSLLIEDEVNRMLSRLLDQTNRLGLTVEQYLASVGKTSEQLQAEYRKTAQEQIKLELSLSTIADEQAVKIKDSKVEAMIKATPDEKTRQALDTPAQRAYIRQILRKRAVIDNLLKL